MLNLDLSGRAALVTGATGEIGRAIARTLAGCGALAMANDKAPRRLDGCRGASLMVWGRFSLL